MVILSRCTTFMYKRGSHSNRFNVAQMGAQQALFKAVGTRDGAMLRHLLRHENASLDEQSHVSLLLMICILFPSPSAI